MTNQELVRGENRYRVWARSIVAEPAEIRRSTIEPKPKPLPIQTNLCWGCNMRDIAEGKYCLTCNPTEPISETEFEATLISVLIALAAMVGVFSMMLIGFKLVQWTIGE